MRIFILEMGMTTKSYLLTKGKVSVNKGLFSLCILFRADAYQSIIMLMGGRQLYTHWYNQAKVNHMEWTEDEATQVLEAWKREFTKVRRIHTYIQT